MITSAGRETAHLNGLLRHITGLRDDACDDGAISRSDKEQYFCTAVTFIAPYASQALAEINDTLLQGTGTINVSGITRSDDGGMEATWTLCWPEQEKARIRPITLQAFFGRCYRHPHLRGGSVGVWPFNVFSDADAVAELVTLRAIAAAELNHLVYQRDWRIVPVTLAEAA